MHDDEFQSSRLPESVVNPLGPHVPEERRWSMAELIEAIKARVLGDPSVVGPTGAQGPSGPAGANGANGSDGAAGPDNVLVGEAVPGFASPADDGKGLLWQGDAWEKASLATDTEVSGAVSAHVGATDPHGDRAYADDLPGRLIARTDLRVDTGQQGSYTDTFTPNAATRKIVVEMVGGGGGGGGVTISTSGAASGGGGGSGAYRKFLVDVAEDQTFDYSLGAGGAGGAGTGGPAAGDAGEGSTWDNNGAMVTAAGGLGGYWMTTGTGFGFAPGGGVDSAYDGGAEGGSPGQPGVRGSNAANQSASGAGGGNPLGVGAPGSTTNSANDAHDYDLGNGGWGGGGSGGQRRSSAGGQAGGAGADGTIIVWEYT